MLSFCFFTIKCRIVIRVTTFFFREIANKYDNDNTNDNCDNCDCYIICGISNCSDEHTCYCRCCSCRQRITCGTKTHSYTTFCRKPVSDDLTCKQHSGCKRECVDYYIAYHNTNGIVYLTDQNCKYSCDDHAQSPVKTN